MTEQITVKVFKRTGEVENLNLKIKRLKSDLTSVSSQAFHRKLKIQIAKSPYSSTEDFVSSEPRENASSERFSCIECIRNLGKNCIEASATVPSVIEYVRSEVDDKVSLEESPYYHHINGLEELDCSFSSIEFIRNYEKKCNEDSATVSSVIEFVRSEVEDEVSLEESPYYHHIKTLEELDVAYSPTSLQNQIDETKDDVKNEKNKNEDIFGNVITTKEVSKIKVECPNCCRKVGALKYVFHLQRCVGGCSRRTCR